MKLGYLPLTLLLLGASAGSVVIWVPFAAASTCLKARVAIAVGTLADSERFGTVPCPAKQPRAAFHYDRSSGTSRLSRALAPEEVVARFPDYGVAMIHAGESLRLVVDAGSVRIERRVVTLQSARNGQHLFVRAADGEVLSVAYGDLAR